MYDYLLAYFKIGDKITAPDKEYLGIKDGMLVGFCDPNEYNPTFSSYMKKVYACVRMPVSAKSLLISGCKPNQDEKNFVKETYRARKLLITLSTLETLLKDNTLEKKWRGKNSVEIVDLTNLNVSDYLKNSDTLNTKAIDINAISSGVYTVGSDITDHYPTWNAAFADIANLTGDLTFNQNSNVVETANSSITENLNGYTFKCNSLVPHFGNPNAGYLTTINHTSTPSFSISPEGSGTVDIGNIYIKNIQSISNNMRIETVTTKFVSKIHDNMIDLNSNGFYGIWISSTIPTGMVSYIYNNEIWDGIATGILTQRTSNTIYVENNSVYNCKYGYDAVNIRARYKNNLAASNSLADFFRCGTQTYGYNNASTDNTAQDSNWQVSSGNLINIVIGNEIESTNDTSINFLKVKSTGIITNNGIIPSIPDNIAGIRGNIRPHYGGLYTIGAYEYKLAITDFQNMNVIGDKVGTKYSRATPAFKERIEISVVVPMDDYKFLKSYSLNTLDADYATGTYTLGVKTAMGSEISSEYIIDLNGNYVKNAVLGPSSGANSKGIVQVRPGKQTASTTYSIDEDSTPPHTPASDTLRMNMSEDDNILMTRIPDGWDGISFGTVRPPYMANVPGHSNSLVLNYNDSHLSEYVDLPMTAIGSINSNYNYRFSFYYRAQGKPSSMFRIRPFITYATNSGTIITSQFFASQFIATGDDELSDFRFFQFVIPKTITGFNMPDNTKRMQISLEITTEAFGSTSVFEMIYPVLEHTFWVAAPTGFISMNIEPNSISGKRIESGIVKLSKTNMNQVLDNTKLFPSHIGRELYSVDLSFDLIDAAFINDLRIIEQVNNLGFNVALRPMHPDLPPVMIGDIKINNNNRHWDYRISSLKIKFIETL